MIEKLKKVSNPLTVIAIFAGLAEISGTVILPKLSESVQPVYVWFLMIFPVLLVLLFFWTLNANHRVLYAPSDFKDEGNFMRLFEIPTQDEQRQKTLLEYRELDATLLNDPTTTHEESPDDTATTDSANGADSSEHMKKSAGGTEEPVLQTINSPSLGGYLKEAAESDPTWRRRVIESLVMDQLSRIFRLENLYMERKYGSTIFDAIDTTNSGLSIIEIGVISRRRLASVFVRMKLQKLSESLRSLSHHTEAPIRIILGIAIDTQEAPSRKSIEIIESTDSFEGHPLAVRVFHVPDLLRQYGWD